MSHDTFPMKASDVLGQIRAGERNYFPFESWALNAGFEIPNGSLPFFRQCESAAEAFLIRHFTQRRKVAFVDRTAPRAGQAKIVAVCGEAELELQVRCALYRIDVVLRTSGLSLAIEVDGLTYHRRTPDDIAAEYLRERRIVVSGHVLVRFTSAEVFTATDECWRQIDLIVAAHARRRSPLNPASQSGPLADRTRPPFPA